MNIQRNQWLISRRHALRGIGAMLTLPLLDCMKPARAAAASTASLPPTRTLVTFTGMGFHSKHWWAKGEGAAMELGPCLKPLEPWKERMVFLRGLWNEQANKHGIHCMQTGNMLSGAPLATSEVRTGVSFDQVMAQRIGDRTELPSLVLGCEEATPGLQDGLPLLYGSHISWSSAVSPTWTETRPALAFDQLFRTERGRDDRRVVDAVLDDAKLLQQKLGSADRQRFEEYLSSVNEIEGRLKRAGKERAAGEWKPTLSTPDRPRPADGIPADLPEYWKLMNDVLLLAFRTDSTRIATLKYCNDASNIVYSHLGIRDHHHYLAHAQPESLIMLNQFFTSQLAYLCQRMNEIKEGDNTLLDNTAIMHCSSMLHGNHDAGQLPVVLLGGAGGNLRGGRVLDYLDKPNRRMCSLFLRLMDWGGLKLDRFNDSTERLPGV
ncbi:hypothetical protein LBMAG56_37220 [Verrucomicrobiota bacterium]|nr:hypothetical protein LBMAG56_37220 [Verrucomicrobiota bacterium]